MQLEEEGAVIIRHGCRRLNTCQFCLVASHSTIIDEGQAFRENTFHLLFVFISQQSITTPQTGVWVFVRIYSQMYEAQSLETSIVERRGGPKGENRLLHILKLIQLPSPD